MLISPKRTKDIVIIAVTQIEFTKKCANDGRYRNLYWKKKKQKNKLLNSPQSLSKGFSRTSYILKKRVHFLHEAHSQTPERIYATKKL